MIAQPRVFDGAGGKKFIRLKIPQQQPTFDLQFYQKTVPPRLDAVAKVAKVAESLAVLHGAQPNTKKRKLNGKCFFGLRIATLIPIVQVRCRYR